MTPDDYRQRVKSLRKMLVLSIAYAVFALVLVAASIIEILIFDISFQTIVFFIFMFPSGMALNMIAKQLLDAYKLDMRRARDDFMSIDNRAL